MTDLTIDDATGPDPTVRLAADGDQAAFANLVAEHHASMVRVAHAITGDGEAAADAVQIAWSIAWRRLGSLRDHRTIRAWLVAIAANEARKGRRRQRGRPVMDISATLEVGAGLYQKGSSLWSINADGTDRRVLIPGADGSAWQPDPIP